MGEQFSEALCASPPIWAITLPLHTLYVGAYVGLVDARLSLPTRQAGISLGHPARCYNGVAKALSERGPFAVSGEVELFPVVDRGEVAVPLYVVADGLVHGVGGADMLPPAHLAELGQVVGL